jgi:hypothetical protein
MDNFSCQDIVDTLSVNVVCNKFFIIRDRAPIFLDIKASRPLKNCQYCHFDRREKSITV